MVKKKKLTSYQKLKLELLKTKQEVLLLKRNMQILVLYPKSPRAIEIEAIVNFEGDSETVMMCSKRWSATDWKKYAKKSQRGLLGLFPTKKF